MASFLAITVPCATVIMCVDHFVLPRVFRISRPLTRVPAWDEVGLVNWPATLALLAAVFFGVTGTASWPQGWLESTPQNSWGPVPLEAWALAGALYLVLVAFARAVAPVRSALGFPKTIAEAAVVSDAVVDVASIAEGRVRPAPTAVPAPGS